MGYQSAAENSFLSSTLLVGSTQPKPRRMHPPSFHL